MTTLPRVNAHVHLPPNFSAFESVSEAIALAKQQDIAVLGTTNYYDYSVYESFAREASEAGIYALFGIEVITLDKELQAAGIKVNDPGNPGKFYLCAKGITKFAPLSSRAESLLSVIQERDSLRMSQMITKMRLCFEEAGIETHCTENSIIGTIAERCGRPRETVYLQERHVAQAFQEALFEAVKEEQNGEETRAAALEKLLGVVLPLITTITVQNALRSHLMKAGQAAYVEETFVDFTHAYQLGLALGGIPCYPIVADGATPMCAFEASITALIEQLRSRKLYCVEWIPVRNSVEVLEQYVSVMRAAGFILTAGTEHNTPEMIPLTPTCRSGVRIPPAIEVIFWEGACVVAAHQHLTNEGKCGYVDSEGNLNPDYSTQEELIRSLAELGASLITAR